MWTYDPVSTLENNGVTTNQRSCIRWYQRNTNYTSTTTEYIKEYDKYRHQSCLMADSESVSSPPGGGGGGGGGGDRATCSLPYIPLR